jgi:hypothetical protein
MHERNVSFEVNQRKKIFSRLVVLEYEYFERIASRSTVFPALLVEHGNGTFCEGHWPHAVCPAFPSRSWVWIWTVVPFFHCCRIAYASSLRRES